MSKVTVKLQDVVDHMEMADDVDTNHFLNRETGEFIYCNQDFMDADEYEEALDEVESGDCVALPTKFDIHEYKIMERFVYHEVVDEQKSNKLANAITGRGAFRRFKNTAHELGLIQDWYDYRDQAYRKIAREWCENFGIKYEE